MTMRYNYEKILTLIIVPFLLSVVFSACQNSTYKYSEYICTDISTQLSQILPDDVSFCGHIQDYHSIDIALGNIAGKTALSDFTKKYGATEEFNIMNFINIYKITKEQFIDYIETTYPSGKNEYKEYREVYDADIIFSGDKKMINEHSNSNKSSFSNDNAPTKNFFATKLSIDKVY